MDHYDEWAKDTEHGLVHAYLVAFFAYHTGRANDHIIRSCLLHDCLRCLNIEPHDSYLRFLYPDLDPVAYRHSNPTEHDGMHPLVIGDRIELLRYHDAHEWIDYSRLTYVFDFADLAMFYQHRKLAVDLILDKHVNSSYRSDYEITKPDVAIS